MFLGLVVVVAGGKGGGGAGRRRGMKRGGGGRGGGSRNLLFSLTLSARPSPSRLLPDGPIAASRTSSVVFSDLPA